MTESSGPVNETTKKQAEAFGLWLRGWLKREGWTQTRLAGESGIGLSTVNSYAMGTYLPKSEAVRRLADAMRLPVEQVMYQAGYGLDLPAGSPLRQRLRRMVELVPEEQLDYAVRVIEVYLRDSDSASSTRKPTASGELGG